MPDQIFSILTILVRCFSAYFLYWLLKVFLPARSPVVFKLLTFFGCFIACVMIIYTKDAHNVLGLFALLTITAFIGFQGHVVDKLSAVIILFPLITAINFFMTDLGTVTYFSLLPNTRLVENLCILSFEIFRAVGWYLIYRSFSKWIGDTVKTLTVKMWIITDLVCLAAFVQIISVLLLAPEFPAYSVYPSCAAAIVTSLGSIYLVSYIAKTIQANLEMKTLKYQQSYYKELDQNQQQIRKLRHDMNNHLCVIGSFLEKGADQEAKDYFRSLSGEFTVHSRIFCENSIVNAVINAKYNEALEKNMDCFLNIDLKVFHFIDQMSLCSIFANTLDNAIEAAAKIEEPSQRKLSLKCRYKDGCFSYELVNAKTNLIRQSRGKYLTDKPDTAAHGMGLETVKEIVKRYHGTMQINHTEDSFSVLIFIQEPV